MKEPARPSGCQDRAKVANSNWSLITKETHRGEGGDSSTFYAERRPPSVTENAEKRLEVNNNKWDSMRNNTMPAQCMDGETMEVPPCHQRRQDVCYNSKPYKNCGTHGNNAAEKEISNSKTHLKKNESDELKSICDNRQISNRNRNITTSKQLPIDNSKLTRVTNLSKGDANRRLSQPMPYSSAAPPPDGYFVREISSNEKSAWDEVKLGQLDTCMGQGLPPRASRKTVKQPVQNGSKPNHCGRAFTIIVRDPPFQPRPLYLDNQSKEKISNELCVDKNQELKSAQEEHGGSIRHSNKSLTPKRVDVNVEYKDHLTNPVCYEKKILNPKSKKVVTPVVTLPVMKDMLMYYYEPHLKAGAPKRKYNNTEQLVWNKHLKQLKKTDNHSYKKQQNKHVNRSISLFSPLSNIAIHNTNTNANGSDIDLLGKNNQTSMSCTSTTSGDAFFSTKTDILSTQEANDTSDNGSTNDLNCTTMTNEEMENDTFGLDLVVDDFIQNAIKEEENEHTSVQNRLDGTRTKSNGNKKKTSTKTETLINKFEYSLPKVTKQDENIKIPESQQGTKPVVGESEPSKKCKKSKAGSFTSSSNHESVKEERRVKQPLNSPKSWETLGKHSSYTPISQMQMASSEQYPTVDTRSLTNSDTLEGLDGDTTCIQSENLANKKNREFNGKEHVSKKEREKPKKYTPDSSTLSILKKSRSSSCEEKSMPSRTNRSKRKSSSALKKSISASPSASGKRKHRGSSSSRQNLKRAESRESSESHAKKVPSLKSAKKKIKKVRILENGSSRMSPEIKEQEERDSSPENMSSSELPQKSGSDELTDTDDPPERAEKQVKEGILCSTLFATPKTEGISDLDSTPSPTRVVKLKINKLCKVTKLKKQPKEDMSKAEQGWDNNFVLQKAELKTNPGVPKKKKRYQLKKTGDKDFGEMNSPKMYNDESVLIEISKNIDDEDAEKELTGNVGKTPTTLIKSSKLTLGKRQVHSPRLFGKKTLEPHQSVPHLMKTCLVKDPREGSSVDAPGYNARAKRDNSLRSTKSGPVAGLTKQNTKEMVENTPGQRVKAARENCSKLSRKNNPMLSPCNVSLSPTREQSSPIASYSTDLDIALGFKRHQSSPLRTWSSGRQPRRDTKAGQSKFRSKSEPEEWKNKLGNKREETCPRRLENFTDQMEMSVLNLGLSWMVQGLFNRISFFNPQAEDNTSISPKKVETQDV